MKLNRRDFIAQTGLAATSLLAFPNIASSRLFAANAPSKRITLGCIGMGGQGTNKNLRTFLGLPDAHIVSVCDVFMSRAHRAQKKVNEAYGNQDCKAFQDFRHILTDPTIDAVVISTPDHWHVPMSLLAMEAGKDVFCEKPTLSINEGRVFADAFAASDRIFQAGIEDRSLIHYHKMVEWVKNGAIGKLERVKVVMPKGIDYALQDPCQPPEDLDWNLWQGPAPEHSFSKSRAGAGQWRNIDMYSKGTILDIGTHLVDTAQIGVDDPDVCPIQVSGTGGIPQGRLTDVPTTFDLTYKYGNGVEMNVKNGTGKQGWDPEDCFLEFQGDQGWVRRKTWTSGLEASDRNILRTRYEPSKSKHFPLPPSEHRNFIDCVKSRKRTTYPALDLHQMSTTLHMGVHCIQLGRTLKWNIKKEEFMNDTEANQLRYRPEARNWEANA